jgi:hypothetical protein
MEGACFTCYSNDISSLCLGCHFNLMVYGQTVYGWFLNGSVLLLCAVLQGVPPIPLLLLAPGHRAVPVPPC